MWYPSFLFWLLETPQAGDKGFGKSPPRDFVCLKHGGKTSLQLLPGSFEVPGTQCPASWPSSPPPMEELEWRVPSFTNHTGQIFFTPLSSSCKNCKVVMFLYPLWVSGASLHSRVGEAPKVPDAACALPQYPRNQEGFLENSSLSPMVPSPAPSRQGLSWGLFSSRH